MRLAVIRANQKGVTLYLGKTTIGGLLQACVIDEWNPDLGWDPDRQGYQRAPMEKHYRRIAEFLKMEGDPLLPTCALLSLRDAEYGTTKYVDASVGGNADFGYIDIPEARQLFIVDYQHRWRGFKFLIEQLENSKAEEAKRKAATLREFQVPFVIMADAPKFEEMRQFYLVNNKQRRVDTDLALALMLTMAGAVQEPELLNLVGPGKRYRIRATRLTFRIAALTTGCWVGRIEEPNNPQPTDVASPKSFADSLRPIISNRSPVYQRPDDALVAIISNYWEGISHLMPSAFQDPRAFAIQKTPGLFTMHRVAAKRVLPACRSSNDFSPGRVAQILQPAANDYLNVSFWRTGGPVGAYGGAAGHKALAELVMGKL